MDGFVDFETWTNGVGEVNRFGEYGCFVVGIGEREGTEGKGDLVDGLGIIFVWVGILLIGLEVELGNVKRCFGVV